MIDLLMPELEANDNGDLIIVTDNGWEFKHRGAMVNILQHKQSGFELVIMAGSLCIGDCIIASMVAPLISCPIEGSASLTAGNNEERDTVGKQLTYSIAEALRYIEHEYREIVQE